MGGHKQQLGGARPRAPPPPPIATALLLGQNLSIISPGLYISIVWPNQLDAARASLSSILLEIRVVREDTKRN